MKKTRTTLDDLARMIAHGFADTATKADVRALGNRMDLIDVGQEQILLRLDQHAHKFEVDDLKRRVGALEDRAGIGHK